MVLGIEDTDHTSPFLQSLSGTSKLKSSFPLNIKTPLLFFLSRGLISAYLFVSFQHSVLFRNKNLVFFIFELLVYSQCLNLTNM